MSHESASGESARRQFSALVADDDLNTRLLLRKILEKEGFAVVEAQDGVEAVEQLRGRRYSLMLLDLMMPRLDGFGVLEFIRSHKPDMERRVVVVTAYPRQMTANESRVCAMVNKPFSVENLRGIIRRCREDLAELDTA